MTDLRGKFSNGAYRASPRRDSVVRLHSPYSEVVGPIVRPGLVSERVLALQAAYDRLESTLSPTPSHSSVSQVSKRGTPTRPPLQSSAAHSSSTNTSADHDRLNDSTYGYGRRKTLIFAPPASRIMSSVSSSTQGRTVSPLKHQYRKMVGDFKEGLRQSPVQIQGREMTQIFDREEAPIEQPAPMRLPTVSRVASMTDEWEKQHSITEHGPSTPKPDPREPQDIPRKSIAEEIGAMIEKALERSRDSYPEGMSESFTPKSPDAVGNPFEEQGFLTEGLEITTSPEQISPRSRTTTGFLLTLPLRKDFESGVDQSQLKKQQEQNEQRGRRRSHTTDTFLPRSSSCSDDRSLDRLSPTQQSIPHSFGQTRTLYHPRRPSSSPSEGSLPRRRSTFSKSRKASKPRPSHDHHHFSIDIHRLSPNTPLSPTLEIYEEKYRPESLPGTRSFEPASPVSTISRKNAAPSETSNAGPHKKWRWWRIILVDKSLSRAGQERQRRFTLPAGGRNAAEYSDTGSDSDIDTTSSGIKQPDPITQTPRLPADEHEYAPERETGHPAMDDEHRRSHDWSCAPLLDYVESAKRKRVVPATTTATTTATATATKAAVAQGVAGPAGATKMVRPLIPVVSRTNMVAERGDDGHVCGYEEGWSPGLRYVRGGRYGGGGGDGGGDADGDEVGIEHEDGDGDGGGVPAAAVEGRGEGGLGAGRARRVEDGEFALVLRIGVAVGVRGDVAARASSGKGMK
ncbi:hypothetical protein MMC06_003407 [Schaereria dolodes]|nr:hypothetical protein [Schaereria dolodes]